MNSAVDMVHRLASTIPTPSKEHSIFDLPLLLSDVMTKLSTAELLTDLLILTIVVVLALELLSNLVYHLPKGFSVSIPVRGKHLDNLSRKDYFFITVNKCMTGLFVYFYFGYLWGVRKVGKEHHHGDDVHEHGAHFGESPCCQGGQGIWALEDLSLVSNWNIFQCLNDFYCFI